MNLIDSYYTNEISIKHSRFIAELFPIENQQQARTMIKQQKTKYFDATHVVHAFIIGLSGEVMGMSDDGEPSGTAGRPVLDVLKGSGCTNVLLTVTRYFGGTLLGTGGLVKAYNESATSVIKIAKMKPYVETTFFSFETNYALYDQIKNILVKNECSEIKENFATSIEIEAKVPSVKFEIIEKAINDLSNGSIVITKN